MNEIQKYEEQPFSLILTTDDFEKVFYFKSPLLSDYVPPTSCSTGGCKVRYFLGRTTVRCDEEDYECVVCVTSDALATFHLISEQDRMYNFSVALPQDAPEIIGSFEWIKDIIRRGAVYISELTDQSIENSASTELYAAKNMPETDFISLEGRRLQIQLGEDEVYEQDISEFYRRAPGAQTEQIINHFGQEYKITPEELKRAGDISDLLKRQGLSLPIYEGEIDLDCTVKLSDPSAINSFGACIVSADGEIYPTRSVAVDIMPTTVAFIDADDKDSIVIVVNDADHETINSLFIMTRLPKDRDIVQETPESLIRYVNKYPGVMAITYKDGKVLQRVRSDKTFHVTVNE